MAAELVAEETLTVGEAAVLQGPSPGGRFLVTFEDDGQTGYFFALDLLNPVKPICDALHIYNVEAVADRDQDSVFQIAWSQDGLKACLIINDDPHAVFDFEAKRGYCRTGFPPADPEWTKFSHEWDDGVVELFI